MIRSDFESLFSLNSSALWVLHTDKIPPHIGISDTTGFYSLKVKGKDTAVPLDKIMALINKKKIPTLIFELSPGSISELKSVFERFEIADSEGITCLEPIKTATNISDVETVHELIRVLEKRKSILQKFGFHLPDSFDGIKRYTKQDILNRLKYLEQ